MTHADKSLAGRLRELADGWARDTGPLRLTAYDLVEAAARIGAELEREESDAIGGVALDANDSGSVDTGEKTTIGALRLVRE